MELEISRSKSWENAYPSLITLASVTTFRSSILFNLTKYVDNTNMNNPKGFDFTWISIKLV